MTDYGMVLQQDLAERCTAVDCKPLPNVSPEAMDCFREGLQHFQAGDPGAALSAFSRSVLQAPEFGEAYIFLGLANALTCNIYPAFDHLEKAIELQPDSFAAHFTLAQLNFKLRIPQKGYDAAREALRCATNLEQRAMLTQLLKEERARERNGIARPSFNKAWFSSSWFEKPWFGKSWLDQPWISRLGMKKHLSALVVAGSGLLVAVVALIVHAR
jgi:tetratricopeptide (TPR) repeat protein